MLSLDSPCRLDSRSSSTSSHSRLLEAMQLLVWSSNPTSNNSSSTSTSMLAWTAQQQLVRQQGQQQQQLQLAQGCMQGVLTPLSFTASSSCSWVWLACHTCQLEVLQASMECLHQP